MMQNSVAFHGLSATGFCTAHVIDLVPVIFCRTDARLCNTPCLGRFERYRLTGPGKPGTDCRRPRRHRARERDRLQPRRNARAAHGDRAGGVRASGPAHRDRRARRRRGASARRIYPPPSRGSTRNPCLRPPAAAAGLRPRTRSPAARPAGAAAIPPSRSGSSGARPPPPLPPARTAAGRSCSGFHCRIFCRRDLRDRI